MEVTSPVPRGAVALPLLTHRTVSDRRRREILRSIGNSSETETDATRHQQVGALYQGYGTHYLDLWIGTPPQRQTVIVDTGSIMTAFPCSGCLDCGFPRHTDFYFAEGDSSTFRRLDCGPDSPCPRESRCVGSGIDRQCQISMAYAEGSSWRAFEALDVAYAGGPHGAPLPAAPANASDADGLDPNQASSFAFLLTFGCQTSLSGLFKTQLADGIMGMGKGESRAVPFWAQMHRQGAILRRKFSLCYLRQASADRGGTAAGAITFGGEDARLHSPPMVYSDDVGFGGFAVHLRRIFLREGGGESARIDPERLGEIHPLDMDEGMLGLNGSGVHVDSGVSHTHLAGGIGIALRAKWEEIAGREYTNDPVELTEEQVRKLPTVMFQVKGSTDGANGRENLPRDFDGTGLAGTLDGLNPGDVIIAMPASHYMECHREKDKYVSRLYLDEGGVVLGANAIMGHDVLFDVDNGRIGWAESNCDYLNLIDSELKPPSDASNGIMTEREGSKDFESRVCQAAGCKANVAVIIISALFIYLHMRRRSR